MVMTYDRYGYLIEPKCVSCDAPVKSQTTPLCPRCDDWPADVPMHEEGGEA